MNSHSTTPNKTKKNNAKKQFIKKSFHHLLFNGFFLFFAFVWYDFWFRILVHKQVLFSGLFLNFLFSFSLSLFLLFIISLFKRRLWDLFVIIIAATTALIFSAQYIYHAFFRTIFTWFSILHGGQVAEFASDIVNKVIQHLPGILLLSLPLLIYFLRRKIYRLVKTKERNESNANLLIKDNKQALAYSKENTKMLRIFSLLGSLIVFIMALFFIYIGDHSVNSAYDLYFETNEPFVASNKIGLISAMRTDFRHLVFPQSLQAKVTSKIDLGLMGSNHQKTDQQIDNSETNPSTIPNPTTNNLSSNNSITKNPDFFKDQILPIDFEEIMSNTSDNVLLDMDNYFRNVTPSQENEYTGIFKGYNLIFITAEGYSKYSPHPEITPTLWHMQENGFKFTNFYNPLWGVSTSDGEYTGVTGLSPKNGVWSMLESANNYMALCPGRMLQRVGYATTAWHNHTYDYYGRDQSHPNLGYDSYIGLGNGLEIEPTWPESDLEMMEETLDIITRTEPFHAYYMTVSGHMFYDYTGNYIAYKNKDLVEDLPFDEGAQAYMATQIEFDKAMEHLLQGLREKGMADRTLIVINADHYPYGLDKKDYDQLAGHELEEDFEIYENSLIFYVDGMEAETIDRPCFTLDIIPTIYNLMGLSYDSRLLMGTDIFSDKDPLVYFANRSWITDKGSYNAVTGEFFPNPDMQLLDADAYIIKIQEEVNSKRDYATLILDYDYYSHLLSEEFWVKPNIENGYLDNNGNPISFFD